MKVGVAFADVIAGKDAAIAILAAVVERAAGSVPAGKATDQHFARGQRARRAGERCAKRSRFRNRCREMGERASESRSLSALRRGGSAHSSSRSEAMANGTRAQRRWACTISRRRTDLAANAGRVKNRDRIVGALAERVGELAAQHWVDRLQSAGVPCGIVRSVAETLEGSHADAQTGVMPSVPGSVRMPSSQAR